MKDEALFTGKERPRQIPTDWIGSPTRSAPGWRWDNPANTGNSVRIFRGDPNHSDPSMRQPFVVVVKNGVTIGADGQPLPRHIAEE
ncbi:MAG TPA: hypothetical protein VL202_19320 [Pararhizobium sp.]|uniref:hypothetical protein n=1 Tax=Pararhizobium sp. TaxID=1977563 RepID=UPI002C4A0F25|nr:hypothetical protein [Pararhizobium sp.]HTO33302.1 hypothetical protein [Pararhizobium sp.]